MQKQDEVNLIFGLLVAAGSAFMMYNDFKYFWYGIECIYDYFDSNRQLRESINMKERIEKESTDGKA